MIEQLNLKEDSSETALVIDKISYDYPSNWVVGKKPAIHDISLTIRAGESFGFLGHNGAGKTTTIKAILGLITLKSGAIKIFNTPHTDTSARKLVGYLPEQPYFYDHLTVLETMNLYATLSGVERAKRQQSVREALEIVGLTDRNKSPMRSLSKGLTQRVAMAQAIVAKPRLLILDEPFSGLDPVGRREFRDILAQLRAQKVTIFMSSHILSDVELLCDRASILSGGRLRAIVDLSQIANSNSGGYELILRDYSSIESIIRSSADRCEIQGAFLKATFLSRQKAEASIKLTFDSEATVHSYGFHHGTLEEVFLQHTQA